MGRDEDGGWWQDCQGHTLTGAAHLNWLQLAHLTVDGTSRLAAHLFVDVQASGCGVKALMREVLDGC